MAVQISIWATWSLVCQTIRVRIPNRRSSISFVRILRGPETRKTLIGELIYVLIISMTTVQKFDFLSPIANLRRIDGDATKSGKL